jgi:hypothetical protein
MTVLPDGGGGKMVDVRVQWRGTSTSCHSQIVLRGTCTLTCRVAIETKELGCELIIVK